MKRRYLLKLSGEALTEQGWGIGGARVHMVAEQIAKAMQDPDLSVALVVGGGNFLRGHELSEQGVERVTADYMGMLATIINGLGMQSALEKQGIETRVLSAINVDDVCEPFIRRRAIRHLEKGRAVIFVGGTGNPYFSTDSAAALRAVEIGADRVLKATKVKGIYSDDPEKNPDAEFLEQVSFTEVLQKDLRVMDSTAISLCRENNLPIVVFNMIEEGNIESALRGDQIGTLVKR